VIRIVFRFHGSREFDGSRLFEIPLQTQSPADSNFSSPRLTDSANVSRNSKAS
jgi:hypothetical protein